MDLLQKLKNAIAAAEGVVTQENYVEKELAYNTLVTVLEETESDGSIDPQILAQGTSVLTDLGFALSST